MFHLDIQHFVLEIPNGLFPIIHTLNVFRDFCLFMNKYF